MPLPHQLTAATSDLGFGKTLYAGLSGEAPGRARAFWILPCGLWRPFCHNNTEIGPFALVAYWIVMWASTHAPLALVAAVLEASIVFVLLFGAVFPKKTGQSREGLVGFHYAIWHCLVARERMTRKQTTPTLDRTAVLSALPQFACLRMPSA